MTLDSPNFQNEDQRTYVQQKLGKAIEKLEMGKQIQAFRVLVDLYEEVENYES